jgi:hypothetical protein
MAYDDLVFSAEPIEDRAYGKRYNAHVNHKGRAGRGKYFGTLRQMSDNVWNFASEDNVFREVVNNNLQTWLYKEKSSVTPHDMLFVVKYSYIVFYYEEFLGDTIEMLEEAFIHGTKKDVEEALRT